MLGWADYQRRYEPIWYGWTEDTKHVWKGGRDQDDVWRIDRPSESPLHPTMKPLALLSRKEAMIRMGCHETQIIRGIVAVRPWISTSDNGPEATRG